MAAVKTRATWISVAAALGYSTQSFKGWRTLPGAPQTPSVGAWRRFIAKNNLGVAGNRLDAKRESLLSDKAAEELAILRLRRAKEEGRTVSRADMDALHFTMFTKQKAVLTAALVAEYPGKCVGRTASEIRVLGEELANRVCDIFIQGVDAWQWPTE